MKPTEEDARIMVESMKIVIELVQFFKAKNFDPIMTSIAIGKYIAIHHSMHSPVIGDRLHEQFVRALTDEYHNAREMRNFLEHSNKSRKIQ